MLEKGYHFVNYNRGGHLLNEFSEMGGSLPANHRGIIVDEETKLLAELFLNGDRNFAVWRCEEAAAGYF